MNDVKKLYEQMLPDGGFILDHERSIIEENQYCYALSSERGEGYFWYYFYEDMFVIEKQDFFFYDEFFLESPEPDFISVQYFFSVSGEEFHPYRQLSPNSLRVYVGGNGKTFQAVYHKNIPIRSTGIEIMPAYYEDYLKCQYPDVYASPQKAFDAVGQTMDFPKMSQLLKQVHDYRGEGIAADLFYEGKVAEAIALTIEWNKRNLEKKKIIHRLSEQDIKELETITLFLNDHYAQDITLESLTKIAYMGATKLQTIFKQYHDCTITETVSSFV